MERRRQSGWITPRARMIADASHYNLGPSTIKP
jgi:hypothetical protein